MKPAVSGHRQSKLAGKFVQGGFFQPQVVQGLGQVQAQEVWRSDAAGMKRLKQLEEENQRLKKLAADLSRDKEMLQDVIRRKISDLPGNVR
jgi:cell shape-determining protein MreC